MDLPCGSKDKRVKVDPATSPPYNWICFLQITTAGGKHLVGSGFKIHMPNINRMIIVTSGHCVCQEGNYAKSIGITFPGTAKVTATSADLYASPEYCDRSAKEFNYGIIYLPGNSDEGFGWSAVISDTELKNRVVTTCGYPGDKTPQGTLWITGGNITTVCVNAIGYMNDMHVGGQSGSPVYTWYKGYWTVVGVHGYAGCVPRFNHLMIDRFLEATSNVWKYSLKSLAFPDVYLRCDGSGVVNRSQNGTVNCQYRPTGVYEAYFIRPREVSPSLALKTTYLVALESAYWTGVYIRMDGGGMSGFIAPGGGVVNCQSFVAAYELFELIKNNDGSNSFRSDHFSKCYLRLDGNGVSSHTGPGGGTVNCQYYESPDKVGVYERFSIEEKTVSCVV